MEQVDWWNWELQWQFRKDVGQEMWWDPSHYGKKNQSDYWENRCADEEKQETIWRGV